MTDNINNICNYRKFIQQCLETIKEQLNTEQQYLRNCEARVNDIEQQIVDAEKQKEDITKLIETTNIEYKNFNKQLSEITIEHETLSKELNEENQSDDNKISSEIQKINHYKKDLQYKLNMSVCSSSNNDELENRKKQEITKLQYFLKAKLEKESNLTACKKEIESLNDNIRLKELEEQINKIEQAITVLPEKIEHIQKNIKSIEEEQLLLYNQEKQNQQLNEELKEIDELIHTIHSYDQEIESTRTRLLRQLKQKI